MSYSGIRQFEQNLRTLMDSPAWQAADDDKRLELGYRMLKSQYGIGRWFGFGRVVPLKLPPE